MPTWLIIGAVALLLIIVAFLLSLPYSLPDWIEEDEDYLDFEDEPGDYRGRQ